MTRPARCLECGVESATARAFCGHCGARLVVVRDDTAVPEAVTLAKTPAPPPTTGRAPDRAPDRATDHAPDHAPDHHAARPATRAPRSAAARRTALVTGLAAVLLVAAGGVGLVVLTDDGDPSAAGGGAVAPAGAARGTLGGKEPASGSASDGSTGAADASDAPVAAACWDGTTAAEPAACPEPDASPAGFAWVFPRIDLSGCESSRTPARLYYSCTVGDVEMNFSRWDVQQTARNHYRGNMASLPRAISGGRQLWRGFQDKNGVGRYKSALLYADHPWSMTTYAGSRAEADRAHREYWMRPASQYRAVDAD